jgi:formylglycine-generating enzyme required for sulfatase activity
MGVTLLCLAATGIAVWRVHTGRRPATALPPQALVAAAFYQSAPNSKPAPGEPPEGMVWISGGEFSMGCADPRAFMHGGPDAMQDARPIHRVYVDGFWMDKTEVTNEQFKEFVDATHYVTVAERIPRAEDFPGAPPENLAAGSVVFTPTDRPVPLDNHYQWWSYVKGASWRRPLGAESDLKGREKYPVVHIAYEDAVAYATWAVKRLPTEAEWEFAARGGLSGKIYVWGDELNPGGKWNANTYQGRFPVQEKSEDGFARLAPVAQFPANGYGLYDMAGNVWEWCSDWYRPDYYEQLAAAGGVARNPLGPDTPFDPSEPAKARASWRLVFVLRPVLHALYGRHPRQGRSQHGQ